MNISRNIIRIEVTCKFDLTQDATSNFDFTFWAEERVPDLKLLPISTYREIINLVPVRRNAARVRKTLTRL